MMQKQCPKCGAAAPIQAGHCGSCQHRFRTQFAADDRTRVVPSQTASVPTRTPVSQRSSDYAVAAMVCGILALLTSVFWFVGAPLAIIALVLAAKSWNSQGRGMAIAGLVTGIIGLVVALWIFLVSAMFAAILGKASEPARTTQLPRNAPRDVKLYWECASVIERQLSDVTDAVEGAYQRPGALGEAESRAKALYQHFRRTCEPIARRCPQVRPLHSAWNTYLTANINGIRAYLLASQGDPWGIHTSQAQRYVQEMEAAQTQIEREEQILILGPNVRR